MADNINYGTATAGYRNPDWWSRDYDSTWDRVKEAFRRDWEQTKHDFGSSRARDLDQDVDDTLKQAVGVQSPPAANQPNIEDDEDFEFYEPAYRFGYGARRHYGSQYSTWNDDLEGRLRMDWDNSYRDQGYDWDRYRSHIRRGWDYDR